MPVDYSLLTRMARESQLTLVQTHQTAFGRRILDLSLAFHEGTLRDDEIEEYLLELVEACQRQEERVRAVAGRMREKFEMLRFFDGVMELAEIFDQMEHREVEARVAQLEESFALTVFHLAHQEAA